MDAERLLLGDAEGVSLGEGELAVDGDVLKLPDGETLAEGLVEGLADGLTDADGETLDDGETLAEGLALGLADGLTLAERLALGLGVCISLKSITWSVWKEKNTWTSPQTVVIGTSIISVHAPGTPAGRTTPVSS